MNRFFLPEKSPESGLITIIGDDANHISNALRKRAGDEIIFTRDGKDFFCLISEIGPDFVSAAVMRVEAVHSEPKFKLTLFQALPKSDKMELVIQKCTELGVSKIVPFISDRCVSRPKDPAAKISRWRRVAESAAKQSGRGIIPEVAEISLFDGIITQIAGFKNVSPVFLCNENGGEKLTLPKRAEAAAVIVGAEGGFTARETTLAESAGAVSITLGSRILRCETAPIAATSIIMYLAGEI
ncbi:MAG: 16S rRNA (uracil(1498)-N(3))-methyltransferase [Ruminococcus sp.]|jgi:16S rRNA (uracil1498-N3)-methyltransferase|nr:16S rRNA (uracil(1498)-N(3))-methyltransferase [Ruminococcus sp.]